MTSDFQQTAIWGGEAGGVQLESPNGLAVDAAGYVYSTDFQSGYLRRFSPDGIVDIEVGGSGTQPGRLSKPIGVAVATDGAIFVSESGSSQVSRFAPDGTFQSAWGGPGSQPGQFQSAMGIAVSDRGEVFVADFGNHRVQVFDSNGEFQREWGQLGSSHGDFENPIGLQLDPSGNVWVVDSGNERIQVFAHDGDLLRVLDGIGPRPEIVSLNNAGEFYVSTPWSDSKVRHFSTDGRLIGTVGSGLAAPHGTATGPSGDLYVAETMGAAIRTFTRGDAQTSHPKADPR